MFCPGCGTETVGGANFCAKCGGPLAGPEKPASAANAKPAKKRLGCLGWIGVGTLTLFILVGGAAAIYVVRESSRSHGPETVPSINIIALGDQKQHVGPSGDVIAYDPSKPAYGRDAQGTGKPTMAPAGLPSPSSSAMPETASSPPADKPKMAMAVAAPKPAAAAQNATAKPGPAKKGYVGLTHVDTALNPDWAGYRADKDTDNTPGIYVRDTADRKYSLHVLRLGCEKPAYANYYAECKNHTVDAAFAVAVTIDDKTDTADCPKPFHPEDGCTALWREKGAAVIAAAKSTK